MPFSPRFPVLGAAVLAAFASACTPPPGATHAPRAPHASAVRTQGAPATPPAPGVIDNAYSVAQIEAAAALARRDYREAERILAEEIERTGESDALLGDLAQVRALAVLGADKAGSAQFDLAVSALDHAIARQPKSAKLFALRGAIAAKERRYADARADFGRALALEPGDKKVRLDAADLAATLHDFTAADKEYRAAIAASPGDFDTWLQRAIMLRARIDVGPPDEWAERYRAAHDALTTAMSLDPSRIEAQYHFAVLLVEHGVARAGEGAQAMLVLALTVLRRFIDETATRPALAAERLRAKQMRSDIEYTTICNFRETEASRKAAEAEAKQRAAEEEVLEHP